MTPGQFQSAALLMQERGIITAGHGWKADLSRLSGWTRPTIDKFEREGTKTIAADYVIAALVAGLEPFPSTAS